MSKEVIFLIHTLNSFGGSQRRATLLANKMTEKGYSVTFISLGDKAPHYPLHPEITNTEIGELCPVSFSFGVRRACYMNITRHIHNRILRPIARLFNFKLPPSSFTVSHFYYSYTWMLRRYLEKKAGATAFAFSPEAAIALAIAADGLPVKTVYCEMNAPVIKDWSDDLIRLRDRYVVRFDSGVFQTEDQKAYYDELITGEKYVIHNPVKRNLPNPYSGQRSKRIVTFCRIDRQKNLPLLIEAFADIHNNHSDYRLEIYGHGLKTEEEIVLSAIRRLRLERNVSVFPFCIDVHQKILDAAMFVSTSEYEGISNSMLEALAIGLPCVCTDCDGGGAREMIRDGENGLLVPKGDKKAVADAIERLISDPDYAE